MCEILTQHGSAMVTCLRLRLKIDRGPKKKDQDIAEYKCGTVCAQNNQEADFQIACATFFFLVYFTVSLVLQCGLDHDDDKTASRQDCERFSFAL